MSNPSTTTATAAPASSPVEKMIGFIHSFWASRALYVAAKLKLLDHLDGASPKTTEQLAAATGAHPRSLYRLLRALASVEVLREEAPGRFVSTEVGDVLKSDHPNSVRCAVIIGTGDDHYDAWGNLLHAVRTGETAFDAHFKMPIWKFYEQNPDNARTFDQAMLDYTGAIHAALLKAYDFNVFKRIIDIGGGKGGLLAAILKKFDKPRGTVFDQPYVVEGAKATLAADGLADRCDTAGDDFFESVPAGGDCYTMKFILHDWEDAKSIRILKNIRKAITPGGKLLVMDAVLKDGNEPDFSKFMDLNMLVMTGGQERTEQEFSALLEAGGFHLSRVIRTESMICIVEATPA